MTLAEARIHRLRMRGRRKELAQARGPFLSGLDHLPWPETSEVIHLRVLRLKGRGAELPRMLAEAVDRMRRDAPSGWMESASDAEAVRFEDSLDRRACLLRDLLLDRASQRWFWSTHPALSRGSLAWAVHAVLLEVPQDLPDVVGRATAGHPGLQERLWEMLLPAQVEELLIRVAEVTGWSPAIWAALALLKEDSALVPPSVSPFREVLSALVEHWPRLARHLGKTTGGSLLADYCRTRSARGHSAQAATHQQDRLRTSTSILDDHPLGATDAGATGAVRASVSPTLLGEASSSIPIGTSLPTHLPPRQQTDPIHGQEPSEPGLLAPPPGEDDAPRATIPASRQAHCGFLTGIAGWFYLLNLLGPGRAEGCWGDLVALGTALGLEPDEGLRDSFTAGSDMDWEMLVGEPGPEDLEDLLAMGRRRYGRILEDAATFSLNARVLVTLCHLDVHFPAEAAKLAVRRVGLDVNPGWIPWLGRTVTFHYGTSEAPS